MIFKKDKDVLGCSFCGKAQAQVKKLIAGPHVYICNECIDICNQIIADDQQAEAAGLIRPKSSYAGTFICPACQITFHLQSQQPEIENE